jgi:hypothetical protein
MNNIKNTFVVLVTATMISGSASAAGAALEWNGTTSVLEDICAFSDASNGVMRFDEVTNVWSVITPANLTVMVSNVDSLTVIADQTLYDGVGIFTDTTVDYRSGSVISKKNGFTGSISTDIQPNTMSVAGLKTSRGFIDISLGGTVKHQTQNVVLASNTDYHIKHTVACVQ